MKGIKKLLIGALSLAFIGCAGGAIANHIAVENETLTVAAAETTTVSINCASCRGSWQSDNNRFAVVLILSDASALTLNTGYAVTIKVNGVEQAAEAYRFSANNEVFVFVKGDIAKTDRSNVIEISEGTTIGGLTLGNSYFVTTKGTAMYHNAQPVNIALASAGSQDNLSRYLLTLSTDLTSNVADNAWDPNIAYLNGEEVKINYAPSGTGYLCIVPYSLFGAGITSAEQVTGKYRLEIPAYTAIGDHYTTSALKVDIQAWDVTPVLETEVEITGLGASARQDNSNRWFIRLNTTKPLTGAVWSPNYGQMEALVNGEKMTIWAHTSDESSLMILFGFDTVPADALVRITIPVQTTSGGASGKLMITKEYSFVFADGNILEDVAYTLTIGDTTKSLKLFDKIGELPAVPAKEHYEGGVWTIDGTAITADTEYAYAKDMTAVADSYTAKEYTVTYVDENNVTVGTATYTVENRVTTEPAVPHKEGYTGAWEAYELTSGDITVKPVYTCNCSNLTEATCTEAAKCTVCGKTHGEANGHTEVVDEAVAPTCTETGLTEGKHCSACNEVFVAQDVVDALGHTEVVDAAVAPTCTETGLTEGKHCSACNEVLVAQDAVDALGHTEVVDAAVAPTCTETGLTEGKHCSVCNESIVAQEEVPVIEHSYENGVCSMCGEEEEIVPPTSSEEPETSEDVPTSSEEPETSEDVPTSSEEPETSEDVPTSSDSVNSDVFAGCFGSAGGLSVVALAVCAGVLFKKKED